MKKKETVIEEQVTGTLTELIERLMKKEVAPGELAAEVKLFINDKASNLKVTGMGNIQSNQIRIASAQLDADRKAMEEL